MEHVSDSLWEFVDGVVLINMDSRPDRLESFMANVGCHIPAHLLHRMSAVVGREIPGYGEPPWFTARTGERAGYWAGAAGCTLSHRKAIRMAREAGWRRVLILEDDVVYTPQQGAAGLLARAVQQLGGPYMLYWGFNRPAPRGHRCLGGGGLDLWQVDGVLATHAYVLSAEAYDTVLAALPEGRDVWGWLARYRAVDTFYRNYLGDALGVEVYALYPTLFSQGGTVSDITGGTEDAACTEPPRGRGLAGRVLHAALKPLRRLKVWLNSVRTSRRAARGGLPGYRRSRRGAAAGRKKVLFLIESLEGGGAEKVLATLVHFMDKARYEVTVCCIQDIGVYVPQVRAQADRYVALVGDVARMRGWQRWWQKKKRNLIHKWLPGSWAYRLFVPKGHDVEVAFLEGCPTRLLGTAPARPGVRRLAWVHTDLEKMPSLEHWFRSRAKEKAALEGFAALVCVSNSAAAGLRRRYNPAARVVTVYNPIDVDEILGKAAAPVELPPRRAAVRLVSCGRFTPQKGFLRLLECVCRLREEGCSVELWLLGDGAERPLYQQYVAAHNMQDYVWLAGFRQNPYAYMAACDLFVCSSLLEGFSTVVTESLVLGLPVVSTRVLAEPERYQDDLCVVTENSTQALLQGLRGLLAGPERLQELRARIAAAAPQFLPETRMPAIEAVLDGRD